MKIRIATNNDAEKISELVKSLSHYYLKDKSGVLPEWFQSTIKKNAFYERIQNSEYSNYLYEENKLIIGYISIKDKSHLYHLFVSEEHQGKGVARKLWEYAANECMSNIYTLRSSLYAVPIYKKFGFVESCAAQENDGIGFQAMELNR